MRPLDPAVEAELIEVGTWGLCKVSGIPTSVFYPHSGENQLTAKRICGQCDLRQRCLDLALTLDEHHGIWGGMNERERNRLKGRKRC